MKHFFFLYLQCQDISSLCQHTVSASVIPWSILSLLKSSSIFLSLSPCFSLLFPLSVWMLFPPLCIHSCLYILSFKLSFFFPLCLCQPVRLSLFSCILFSKIILSLIVFFVCLFVLFYFFLSLSLDDPPATPSRSILMVYFLSLKPWRWIIEQTDPWLRSCCSVVWCRSFLQIHFSSLSAPGLVFLSAYLNNLSISPGCTPYVWLV